MMLIYSILSLKINPGQLSVLLNRMKGISGTGLFAVSFNEISAVVSETESAAIIAVKSNAIEYAGIIEKLSHDFTLLPMRFGSVMGSDIEIIKMLETNYSEIQTNLNQVENKFEFGLKVFCDSEKLKEGLQSKTGNETKTSASIDQEIKKSVFRDYVNKKLKEHRLEELMLNFIDSVIEKITRHLARLNAVSKFKKMATASIIVDAVFILDKGSKDDLIDTVRVLQDDYPELNFVLTGPWPPYNFVETTIK
jgi:hypothetical protein